MIDMMVKISLVDRFWCYVQILISQNQMIVKLQQKHKIETKNKERGDSKKKQKPSLGKVISNGMIFKKSEIKKHPNIKREETISTNKRSDSKNSIPQSNSTSNLKTSVGSASNSQPSAIFSSKYMMNSIRTSPKSSLADLHCINLKKVSQDRKKKIQFTNKINKDVNFSTKKVKEQVKQSLAKVIKVYEHDKKSYLDISMTEVTSDGLVKDEKLSRIDFNFLEVIGQGGYGKVWKVQHLKSRGIYAMKEMSKALIIMKKSVQNVLNQLRILSNLKHPFITNMTCAFNDRDNLYLGMDYLQGGDFRYFLSEGQKIREEQARFLIACLLKAIQYIHRNKIFHRDIKPENLVLDDQGYLRLTDFGIARFHKDKNSLDASGTPGYMAPEVICKQVHSYSVDFYAVGIICYELMMGKRPYTGQNRTQIRDAILSKQHSVKKKQIPSDWSLESADFINKLIIRQPLNRLGNKNGVIDLISHPWFNNFKWKQLESKSLISPIKRKQLNTDRMSLINSYDETVNQYRLLQRTDQNVDVFGAYFSNFR